MRIFLLAGKSGSGKGEVAKLIKEFYIYKLEKCAITGYSKYLKVFLQEISDWDGSYEKKPRGELQKLGDTIREFDEKYFIKKMIEDLQIYEKLVDNVVISDVRFPAEIDDVRLNYDNVYAIYVENQFSESKLSVKEQAHITETALDNYDDFDYVLANDDINDLKDKVFKFLESVK